MINGFDLRVPVKWIGRWLCYAALCCGGVYLTASGFAAEPDIEQREAPPAEKFAFTIKHARMPEARPEKSPDGKFRAKADGLELQLLDAETGKPVASFKCRPRRKDTAVSAWAFDIKGERIAIGTGDARGVGVSDSAGEVRVYDIASGKLLGSVDDSLADIGYVWQVSFGAEPNTINVICEEISGK